MASSKRSIRLGLDYSAPIPLHTDYRSARFEGFEVDMIKDLANLLDLDISYSVSLWTDILEDLEKGNIDAICSAVTITEARRRQFDFSLPYLEFHLAVICHVDNVLPDLASLNEKKIGVRPATEAEKYIQTFISDPHVLTRDTNDELYALLKTRQIDALIDDSPIAAAFDRQNHTSLTQSFLLPDSTARYGIAFKKGSDLRPKMDEALQTLEKGAKLEALRVKWLGNTTI